jgi:hypothetical protein
MGVWLPPERGRRRAALHAGVELEYAWSELVLGRCLRPSTVAYSLKSALVLLLLVALLGFAVWWAVYAWNSVDVEMGVHGYIAMILGIVFSLVLGCGLMGLMF